MDMPRSEVRDLRFDQFSVTKHLEHASAQARQRNYQDFLIVDVGSARFQCHMEANRLRYSSTRAVSKEVGSMTAGPGTIPRAPARFCKWD